MTTERYDIARTTDGWVIFHNGELEGCLDTKTAAFDHAVAAAVPSIRAGRAVTIRSASDIRGCRLPRRGDENIASYQVSPQFGGWAVIHDGQKEAVLDSEMAAFDAAVGAAVASLASGFGVIVTAEAASDNDSLPQE